MQSTSGIDIGTRCRTSPNRSSGRSFSERPHGHGADPGHRLGRDLDIECTDCGNGPLVLLGETLPGMPVDERARDRAVEHLRRTGWRVDADAMRCPGCARRAKSSDQASV